LWREFSIIIIVLFLYYSFLFLEVIVMAYVAPTIRSVGDAVTAADYNIMANDVIAFRPGHLILTTTERDALAGWSTGSEIYNTTTGAFEMYNGTSWVINRPFAIASGSIAYNASQNVTFPTNRFTVAPIVTMTAVTRGLLAVYLFTGSITTAGFSWENSANPGSGTYHYHAYQMTATSATG
jgi:hypothetical protein